MYVVSFCDQCESWTPPLSFRSVEAAERWLRTQNMEGAPPELVASVRYLLAPGESIQWRYRSGGDSVADYILEDGKWVELEEPSEIPF